MSGGPAGGAPDGDGYAFVEVGAGASGSAAKAAAAQRRLRELLSAQREERELFAEARALFRDSGLLPARR